MKLFLVFKSYRQVVNLKNAAEKSKKRFNHYKNVFPFNLLLADAEAGEDILQNVRAGGLPGYPPDRINGGA